MSEISIVKCNTYEPAGVRESVERAINALGGAAKYIKPGMRVVLKPNLVMGLAPERAATTHPSIVAAMCDIITENGASATILDGPGNLHTPEVLKGIYKNTGMMELAAKQGVEANLDISITEIDNPEAMYLKKLTVIKPLADADLVINLPKMKTHCQMIYTGAVKNLFGAIPGLLKMEYHFRMPDYDKFADTLIDIFLSIKPALSIMDGVVGMDGDGPTAGRPVPMNLILASEDAFALDLTASFLMGVDFSKIPVLKRASERNLFDSNIDGHVYYGANPHESRLSGLRIPSRMSVGWVGGSIGKVLTKIMEPKITFKKSCIGCGYCSKICPAKAISIVGKTPQIDRSICIKCFCCHELCPAAAIIVKRPWFLKLLLPGGEH